MIYIFIYDEPIFNLISKKKLLLSDEKANILTFDSGINAINYFEDNFQELNNEKIVLFLDINMPEINTKFDSKLIF